MSRAPPHAAAAESAGRCSPSCETERSGGDTGRDTAPTEYQVTDTGAALCLGHAPAFKGPFLLAEATPSPQLGRRPPRMAVTADTATVTTRHMCTAPGTEPRVGRGHLQARSPRVRGEPSDTVHSREGRAWHRPWWFCITVAPCCPWPSLGRRPFTGQRWFMGVRPQPPGSPRFSSWASHKCQQGPQVSAGTAPAPR